MTERLPALPLDEDELPPCIGARLRDETGSYALRQHQALVDASDAAATEASF